MEFVFFFFFVTLFFKGFFFSFVTHVNGLHFIIMDVYSNVLLVGLRKLGRCKKQTNRYFFPILFLTNSR